MATHPDLSLRKPALVLAAVLSAPLALYGYARYNVGVVEDRAARIASSLTNRTITVSCPGPIKRRVMAEILHGKVQIDADGVMVPKIELMAPACDGLEVALDRGPAGLDMSCLATPAGCRNHEPDAALGISVLTHEIMHQRGNRDEAVTQCLTGKHSPRVATMSISPCAHRQLRSRIS